MKIRPITKIAKFGLNNYQILNKPSKNCLRLLNLFCQNGKICQIWSHSSKPHREEKSWNSFPPFKKPFCKTEILDIWEGLRADLFSRFWSELFLIGLKGGLSLLFECHVCAVVAVAAGCPALKVQAEIPNKRKYELGSGCGSVGRVVASETRGPRFESSYWNF